MPDTEVLKKAGMKSVNTLMKRAHLRWTGRVTSIQEYLMIWIKIHG